MDHLEVLLLIHREKDKSLSFEEIVSQTARPRDLVQNALADLVSGGLVSQLDNEPGILKFAYAPKSQELALAVEQLAAMYNERPVTLIRAIYDRPPEPVMSFADAFRLRGKGK
jgi:DNA-binding IclR family transcriptional regulator